MIRKLFIATALVACSCVAAAPVSAQVSQGNSANNLFAQYTSPVGASSVTAGMYPAPHPSPLLGAQSMYTYQPLMPHEMMYQHSRNYYNYYNTGGYFGAPNALNRTQVRWQSGTNHMGPLPFTTGLGDLNYRFYNRRYCINGDCDGRGLQGGLRSGGCNDGNCGGAIRGRLRGGGLGCNDGSCGSTEVYDTGCASGTCAQNPGVTTRK